MSEEWQFLIALKDRLRAETNGAEVQEFAARLLGEHLHASRVTWSHGHDFRGAAAIVEACRRRAARANYELRNQPSTRPRSMTFEPIRG